MNDNFNPDQYIKELKDIFEKNKNPDNAIQMKSYMLEVDIIM
jgi:hypothetical protein